METTVDPDDDTWTHNKRPHHDGTPCYTTKVTHLNTYAHAWWEATRRLDRTNDHHAGDRAVLQTMRTAASKSLEE